MAVPYTFIDGTASSATEVNTNFNASKIYQIYTGTGFDASQSGTGTTTNNVELTVSAANLLGAAYVVIIAQVNANVLSGTSGDSASASLKLESKYVGGAYATDFDFALASWNSGSSGSWQDNSIKPVHWVHTLTANELANGITFKFTGTATANNAGGGVTDTANIVNLQTVLKGAY